MGLQVEPRGLRRKGYDSRHLLREGHAEKRANLANDIRMMSEAMNRTVNLRIVI